MRGKNNRVTIEGFGQVIGVMGRWEVGGVMVKLLILKYDNCLMEVKVEVSSIDSHDRAIWVRI